MVLVVPLLVGAGLAALVLTNFENGVVLWPYGLLLLGLGGTALAPTSARPT